jgi:hypothetical protein
VLPGAFSAYRYIALQNDSVGEGPLHKYFLGEKMVSYVLMRISPISDIRGSMVLEQIYLLPICTLQKIEYVAFLFWSSMFPYPS